MEKMPGSARRIKGSKVKNRDEEVQRGVRVRRSIGRGDKSGSVQKEKKECASGRAAEKRGKSKAKEDEK